MVAHLARFPNLDSAVNHQLSRKDIGYVEIKSIPQTGWAIMQSEPTITPSGLTAMSREQWKAFEAIAETLLTSTHLFRASLD